MCTYVHTYVRTYVRMFREMAILYNNGNNTYVVENICTYIHGALAHKGFQEKHLRKFGHVVQYCICMLLSLVMLHKSSMHEWMPNLRTYVPTYACGKFVAEFT